MGGALWGRSDRSCRQQPVTELGMWDCAGYHHVLVLVELVGAESNLLERFVLGQFGLAVLFHIVSPRGMKEAAAPGCRSFTHSAPLKDRTPSRVHDAGYITSIGSFCQEANRVY